MRHALILRALSLPLAAAFFICCVIVAMTPYSRFDAPPERLEHLTVPVAKLAPLDTSAPAGERPGQGHITPLSVDEVTVFMDEQQDDLSEDQSFVSDDDATYAKALFVGLADAIESTVHRTAARLKTAIATATQQVVGPGRTTLADAADIIVNRSFAAAGLDSTDARVDQPASDTAPPVLPAPRNQSSQVDLSNRPDNTYPVAFLLNDQPVKLEPGDDIVSTQPATVRFDRGGGLGTVTRSLTGGRYEFRLTNAGWELLPAGP
jgi:hypothetical protein